MSEELIGFVICILGVLYLLTWIMLIAERLGNGEKRKNKSVAFFDILSDHGDDSVCGSFDRLHEKQIDFRVGPDE